MKISAGIKNSNHSNDITVATEENQKKINIPSKADGFGSSVNGGELLFLSLATCFCNDLYREANRRKIEITEVEVNVTGEFGQEGEPASNITYNVNVQSLASERDIADLIAAVDKVAEVHNTLRKGINVSLNKTTD